MQAAKKKRKVSPVADGTGDIEIDVQPNREKKRRKNRLGLKADMILTSM